MPAVAMSSLGEPERGGGGFAEGGIGDKEGGLTEM